MRDSEIDRQKTNGQKAKRERHASRQAKIEQANGKADKDREIGRHKERDREKQTVGKTEKSRQSEKTGKQTNRQRERERDGWTQTDKHTDTFHEKHYIINILNSRA